jgi:hypothetical protein
MTKHNKYYWDLDRNKSYKNSASSHASSSDSQFKSVYVGDKSDEELNNNNQIGEKQREINIIITGFRILGYGFIPFSLILASCILILSELISWILIFDNKK